MRDIVQQIGPTMKEHILFLHAWHGCDTTSAIFEKGKTALCKKIESFLFVICQNKLHTISPASIRSLTKLNEI